MITKVEVRNSAGTLLTLTLDDMSDGLVVQDIQGLDPVNATVVTTMFAQLDGSQFQAAHREARNIIFRIGLEPDYVSMSVRALRSTLYSFFMPKSEVFLRFFDVDGEDELTVDISGRVETFESVLFTKEPSVDISIICFDPDFVELTPIVVEGETVADTTETLIDYEGSIETGFVFVLSVDRTLSEFTIYSRGPDDVVRTFSMAADLVADDILTITTIDGRKSVILTRSGIDSSLLYGMAVQSTWIELFKGENNVRVYTVGDPIPYTISYTPRHGGL
jgi:tail protein